MWGAIASIGSSLIGGLFGRKKQTTSNHVDYQRMVHDAEAAGFNPLTALRNGGAAGFSVSTTPGAPLSSAFADGAASFLANFDPHADQKRELEYDLVQAQIANLNASTDNFRSRSFNVPGHGAGTIERRPSGQAAQLASGTWDRMNTDALGLSWGVNPANTPAQELEDQYGELGGSGVGGLNLLDDLHREAKAQSGSDWGNQPLPNVPKMLWNWWQDAADADYERHRKKYARPALGR